MSKIEKQSGGEKIGRRGGEKKRGTRENTMRKESECECKQ